MGFAMNAAYISGLVVDFTRPERIEFGGSSSLEKVYILISYVDPNSDRAYKIPLEVLTNTTKMGLLMSSLRENAPISVDARLISTQFTSKNTGKPITYLKLDPYVIYFPETGRQLIFKSRYIGNNATSNIDSRSPYTKKTPEESKAEIARKIDGIRGAPPEQPTEAEQASPKSGQDTNYAHGQANLEEDIPF